MSQYYGQESEMKRYAIRVRRVVEETFIVKAASPDDAKWEFTGGGGDTLDNSANVTDETILSVEVYNP